MIVEQRVITQSLLVAYAVLLLSVAFTDLGSGDEVCGWDTLSDGLLAIGCGCLMGGDVVACIGGKWALKCEDGGGGNRC